MFTLPLAYLCWIKPEDYLSNIESRQKKIGKFLISSTDTLDFDIEALSKY